jgi:hypothetical protein
MTRNFEPAERIVRSGDFSRYADPPRTITPSTINTIGPSKLLEDKEFSFSKVGGKDNEREKENLISEIRERDATIARLLRDVREKRALRMRDVETLSDRMDFLEARLLSQHLHLLK